MNYKRGLMLFGLFFLLCLNVSFVNAADSYVKRVYAQGSLHSEEDGSSVAGRTYPNYFKSSLDSLMNYGNEKRLNLITAGYCLNAVNK